MLFFNTQPARTIAIYTYGEPSRYAAMYALLEAVESASSLIHLATDENGEEKIRTAITEEREFLASADELYKAGCYVWGVSS